MLKRNIILEQEESEQYVLSLVSEILSNAETIIHDKNIDIQILPFATDFFKDSVMFLMKYCFFSRDEGVKETLDFVDDEPQPGLIDSWARGVIPVKTFMETTLLNKKQPKSVDVLREIQVPNEVEKLSKKLGAAPLPAIPFLLNMRNPERQRRVSMVGTPKKPLAQIQQKPLQSPLKTVDYRIIPEENKRTLAKISAMQKDGKKPTFGYDPNGKILIHSTVPRQITKYLVPLPVKVVQSVVDKPVKARELKLVEKRKEVIGFTEDLQILRPFIDTIIPAPGVVITGMSINSKGHEQADGLKRSMNNLLASKNNLKGSTDLLTKSKSRVKI